MSERALVSTMPTHHPPGSWALLRRLARRATNPVERFLAIEAASGLLLVFAAVAAIFLANSSWSEAYAALWHTPLGVTIGHWRFEKDLHFVINDGLMTVFFFVVGLEIRREIHNGELSELRRAMLPLAAAVGGMIAPALWFMSMNRSPEAARGWGIPMATDIAFAVGVLALLGKRVAPALRILLLALAVIDDVGAILVIAIFYSSGIAPAGLVILLLGIVAVLGLTWLGVRSPWAYVPAGVVVWAGAYSAGVHPTLAGVILGLMTPVQAWYGPEGFLKHAEENMQVLREARGTHSELDSEVLLPRLHAVRRAQEEAIAPVERLQHALHGWVAFGIMPFFAFANAGVPLGRANLDATGMHVFLGIGLGLALGKPVGVLGLSWLMTQLGVTALPRGVSWWNMAVVGLVAGVGFTMALFVAQLAFPPGPVLETSKLAILSGSACAAVLAYVLGRALLPPTLAEGAARTALEAEQSTLS